MLSLFVIKHIIRDFERIFYRRGQGETASRVQEEIGSRERGGFNTDGRGRVKVGYENECVERVIMLSRSGSPGSNIAIQVEASVLQLTRDRGLGGSTIRGPRITDIPIRENAQFSVEFWNRCCWLWLAEPKNQRWLPYPIILHPRSSVSVLLRDSIIRLQSIWKIATRRCVYRSFFYHPSSYILLSWIDIRQYHVYMPYIQYIINVIWIWIFFFLLFSIHQE